MKKTVLIGCCVIAVMAFLSCKSNSSGDTNDTKSEDEIVSDMLTTKQQTILKDLGMPINEGMNPPDITGFYLCDDFDCVEDTTDLFLQNLTYYYNFHGKDGNNILVDYYNSYKSDIGKGKGAYIFGEGNKFSVYMEATGAVGTITYTTVSIYSGTLTADGIKGFTQGFIMTSKTGDDDDSVLMPVNAARIYEEGDALAQALTTNPGFNAIMKSVKADGEAVKATVLASAKR